MTLVVDANVALWWSFDAPSSGRALKLLSDGDDLIAPDLIIPEVTNALWVVVKTMPQNASRAREAIELLPRWFSEIVPSHLLRMAALDLALELRHPAYDCYYLALALARNTRLVSADARFLQRARACGYSASVIALDELG